MSTHNVESSCRVSDLIAMGTVFGDAACGGSTRAHIPFQPGRIDARSAGPPGIPEPQQDLQSHIESFKRQEFNQSEMVALVACGHALGVLEKGFSNHRSRGRVWVVYGEEEGV
ncbi:hypothetical protein PM082_006829 [Marasmius tenuissimus]|nr:hypothetical protein PM082_006829 [Marasmius tenuissimus]